MTDIKIEFRCRLCNESKIYTEPKFIAHLDIQHSNIENYLRTELAYDFAIEKIKKNIEIKTTELSDLKKSLNKLGHDKKKNVLKEFRNKVLKSLENSDIDSKNLEIINTRKSIQKLKVYLSRGLGKEYRINLENSGIDYKVSPTKKKKKIKYDKTVKSKKKNKLRYEKDYFDKTINSIRPIYTPMGNKR